MSIGVWYASAIMNARVKGDINLCTARINKIWVKTFRTGQKGKGKKTRQRGQDRKDKTRRTDR
jgi:hypothetical protein